ncbi:MAG: pyridine nucleotide-disulfide oxidoreductase [Alteromonadaceae bacterium]|nr:pyridine nucleotide-disulfide oxidoreductase [Alteromonadaceae bacterium]MBH85125.1 pyridine nucleotide-disulfide oxidoreductase [Alteromonadaceae bacterium]|tara:strand:+ start:19001 stop:20212 length:1212 start_codon:yes stop_codon:yes gene_type:complete
MDNRKLVVIGHGMVAQRLLERLVAEPANPYTEIDVLNAEAVPAYNRILLSSVLAGDASMAGIALQSSDWFREHGIRLHSSEPATAIDTEAKTVMTASGKVMQYDDLVLATGSRAASLKLPGETLEGVVSFRNVDDTEKLLEMSRNHRRAVVIGGGFLGLEAAEGLRQQGMSVTVIHRGEHLLNRQLDPTAGKLLEDALVSRGIHVATHSSPLSLVGQSRVRAVELTDETLISTDLVVLATGITPNREIAEQSGIECDRGILVDSQLRTSQPSVFAVGECCQLGKQTFGLVEPGYQQADTLAQVLCHSDSHFKPGEVATRLKISGIPIFSCGHPVPGPDTESVIWQDHDTARYCHLLLRNNRLAGAVLFGETQDGPWYFDQLQQQRDLSAHRQQLAFGAAYCTA